MEPINRIPVTQQVEERLKQMIESGAYGPGCKLPTEMELCQTLGVGRGTVREAFRSLQARGYVELRPGRGAFAADRLPSDELGTVEWLVRNELQLHDAIEVRRALEPMAARRMTELGDPAAVEELAALHEQFLAAVAQEDIARIAALDEAFHSAIVAASGNRLLIAINQQVNQEIKTFRSKTFQVPQNVKNAVVPHSSILHAIRTGDSDGAEAAMRAHLDKVQEDLLANIGAPAGGR